jgi:hypothetical protein
MWNLKETALGKTKEENALIIKEMLEALMTEISEIKFLEVGLNDKTYAPSNHDVVLINKFENFDMLKIYNNHPKHQKVAKFIKQVINERVAVDYIV